MCNMYSSAGRLGGLQSVKLTEFHLEILILCLSINSTLLFILILQPAGDILVLISQLAGLGFFFHLDLTTEMQLEEKVSIMGLFIIVECSLGNLLTNAAQLKSAAICTLKWRAANHLWTRTISLPSLTDFDRQKLVSSFT